MNKKTLLKQLTAGIESGTLTKKEVLQHLELDSGTKSKKSSKAESSHFSATKVLYILGAAIVIIGIIIFVGQIWDDIGAIGRILVTLGLGFVFASLGSLLLHQRSEDNLGAIFHFIGGALIPSGAMVTLSELSTDVVSLWPVTIVFGFIFAFYLLLTSAHKHPVLTFFAIAMGTTFLYLFVESMVDGPFYQHENLYAYLTMVTGISYLLLAHAFREGWNKGLSGLLCFMGSTAFFTAAFSQVFDSLFWELLYFVLVLGGLFLSTHMKSRSILVVSTLFLLVHVSYITGEYFANSLGWPMALVLLGFIFIGLGYLSVNIHKKYIK